MATSPIERQHKFWRTVTAITSAINRIVRKDHTPFYLAQVNYNDDGTCIITIDNAYGKFADTMAEIAQAYDRIEVLEQGDLPVCYDWKSATCSRPCSYVKLKG